MSYYLNVLKNYATFSGRAGRSEYWFFVLFNAIISIVLNIIGRILDFQIIGTIYSFFVLIPSIAVGIRRMHDVNKSGWFILIPIYNLILFCTDSTQGETLYGSDPRAITK